MLSPCAFPWCPLCAGARIASLRALLDSLSKRHEEEGRPVDAAADDLEAALRSVSASETLVESLPGKKPGTSTTLTPQL